MKGGEFLKSSIKRIKNDIETITKITATPGKGCTRFSYSKEDKEVRDYLMKIMRELDLDIKIDGVGNIRAKYENDNISESSIMIGSHIDTVANGGKFDGLTGVITALEVIRVLHENDLPLKRPVELVIFAEEEGSNFGITMVGSKVLSGKYNIEDLKEIKDDSETSAYEIIKNFGLEVDKVEEETLEPEEVDSMIELHVEQGGILDSENIPVGIVQAIVGMSTYKIKLKGVSNHAGSTPMNLRNDPMVAAASVITKLKIIAEEDALENTVATVGKIHCEPNVPNVIPEEVEFFVDIRDVDEKGIEIVEKRMKEEIKKAEEVYDLKAKIELLGKSDSVTLSTQVIDSIEEAAVENNYNFKEMNSGAVHDAAMLTELANVGMIFVPSINGKSHCPDEVTNYEDIELGSNLLLDSVMILANK